MVVTRKALLKYEEMNSGGSRQGLPGLEHLSDFRRTLTIKVNGDRLKEVKEYNYFGKHDR